MNKIVSGTASPGDFIHEDMRGGVVGVEAVDGEDGLRESGPLRAATATELS